MLIVFIYLPVSFLNNSLLHSFVSIIRILLKSFLFQEEAFLEKRFLAKMLKNMEYYPKEVPEALILTVNFINIFACLPGLSKML